MNRKIECNQIDWDAHQSLIRKGGTPFLFSVIWRVMLVQGLPLVIVGALSGIGMASLNLTDSEELSMLFLLGIGVVSFLLIAISTTPYLVNKFSHLQYKDFKVCLVKDDKIIDTMGFYDSLCWMGSFVWRNMTLGLIYGATAFIIDEYGLISGDFMRHIERGMQFACFFLALYWLLRTKKKGRLILLQPKTEPASETIPT